MQVTVDPLEVHVTVLPSLSTPVACVASGVTPADSVSVIVIAVPPLDGADAAAPPVFVAVIT